jgi:hypothetical protein
MNACFPLLKSTFINDVKRRDVYNSPWFGVLSLFLLAGRISHPILTFFKEYNVGVLAQLLLAVQYVHIFNSFLTYCNSGKKRCVFFS